MRQMVDVGIDLGTTNSSLAVLDDPSGQPRNARVSGNDLPYDTILRSTARLIGKKDSLRHVQGIGQELSADPGDDRFVKEFKPWFARPVLRRPILKLLEKDVWDPRTGTWRTSGTFHWAESEERYSRMDLVLVAAGIFRKLFDALDPRVRHEDVAAWYLGVPFNTWGLARRRLLSAMVLSGLASDYREALDRVRFVPEAVAVSSTLDLVADRVGTPQHVLIFDFGGGTLDLAVLRFEGEPRGLMFPAELLALGGLARAGSHINELIFRKVHGIDGRALTVEEELDLPFAEGLKIALSTSETASIPFRRKGIVSLDRRTLTGWLAATLAEIREAVLDVLARAELTPREIDRVYTAGGSSLLPQVKDLLESLFGKDNETLQLHKPAERQPGGSCEQALTAVCKGLTLSGSRERMRERVGRSYHVLTAEGALVELLSERSTFDPTGKAEGSAKAVPLPAAGGWCTVALYEKALGQYQHVLNFVDVPLPEGARGLNLHLEVRRGEAFPTLRATAVEGGAPVRVVNVADLEERQAHAFIESDGSNLSSGRGKGARSPAPPPRPIGRGDLLAVDGRGNWVVESLRDINENRGVAMTEHPDLKRYCLHVSDKDRDPGRGYSQMQIHRYAHEIRLADPPPFDVGGSDPRKSVR